MRLNKAEKERRAALLTAQHNKCALCSKYLPTAIRMILIKEQNAIICKACDMFKSVYLSNIHRGITPEILAAFLARQPAPEPSAVSVVEHKKLTPERLQVRFMYGTGQWAFSNDDGTDMTRAESLAEHDARTGASGPVVDPDTGLEWVPEVVEDQNEQEKRSERMFIDGVECDADGKPISE